VARLGNIGEIEMYLFFDTETADLPIDYNAPIGDLDNWPNIVQIAWITANSSQDITGRHVELIRPYNFIISTSATRTHGITTADAFKGGTALYPIMEAFIDDAQQADIIVAHNIEFDISIVGAEAIRLGFPNPFSGKSLRCTMTEATDFCQLPGPYGYKWPKLTELYQILFDKELEGAHDALNDVDACMQSFFKLRELGVITVERLAR